MKKALERGAGILLPISSLPSPYGIGSLGKEAYEFVDRLKEAGQRYWQVLPIGPTSFGDSPYQSFSAFAGNPYFIDFDILIHEGLLTQEEVDAYSWYDQPDDIDYARLYRQRFEVLRKAYGRSKHETSRQYAEFLTENESWLPDYALYMAVKADHGNKEWLSWEEPVLKREETALRKCGEQLHDEIGFYMFLQFKFDEQWKTLKSYANRHGISLIGDIPIYVALDSADVWANTEQFQLDHDLQPVCVAGCPPDAFSDYGQKWGNPLYDWDRMEQDGFSWWKNRIRKSASLYDVIRIDHFIGVVRYYNIPADGEPKNGFYLEGPGKKLVDAIDSARGNAKVIAEDLGVVVPEVQKLVKESGYPGMKILQFGFDGNAENEHAAHNHEKNYVVYIGTHDNDTLKGYIENASKDNLTFMMKYLGAANEQEIPEKMMQVLYMSPADTVIVQMQDLLGKDNEARMNLPSTIGTNWRWRMKKGEFTDEIRDRLRELTRVYGRNAVKQYFCKEDIMLTEICKKKYNKTIKECSNEEIYFALLDMTKELAEDKVTEDGKKKVYYISAEFLIGKLLSNNLINLGIFDEVKQVLAENGKSIYDIEEVEPEPSLGNGGLGRLAACFLDSMATLGLPGDGIGLNYHMGLFKQVFENNYQKETANPWIEADSWLTKTDVSNTIRFGNCTVQSRMYDIDVTGYENRTNKLHLFDIESVDESIMEPDGISFDKTDIKKNLTLCLYPDDSDEAGNLLRIYQQYFMVANGAKLILAEAKEKGSNLHDLADYAAIQINDTHPSMVIPELIRLLMEEARFILPATLDPKPVKDDQGRIMGDGKFRVNFRVITDNTGKNFFPCFTNDEEFEHAIKEVEVEKMALTYKEVAPLVLNSNGQIQGIVIDPYTVGMQVPDALIKTVDESRKSVLEEHKNTNIKKHTIPANTKIRLRSPKYMPVDMLDEAKKFLAERPNVKAAYIQMMEKENSDEEYLITIDFEGDEEDLFDSLLPKIKPLAFGIPIALTGTDNGLGKKVTENTEPFYKKEIVGDNNV